MSYRRHANYGMIDGIEKLCPAVESLAIWRRMCRSRYFDLECDKAVRAKQVSAVVYLSTGQESISASVAGVLQEPIVFTQHRGQAAYLAFGGEPRLIIDELLGLETGCCKGMGGAPFLQDKSKKIYGHDCLLGSHVPIAVGAAYVKQGMVVCFMGDGAVEEDYMYGSMGFAATHKLSILFVVEDNDLSVLTPTKDRRNWQIANVATAMGIASADITDDPWLVRHHTLDLLPKLPALLNVRTCREFWHAGAGCDGPAEWNRFEMVRETMRGLGIEVDDVETKAQQEMESLWRERLQIPSGN